MASRTVTSEIAIVPDSELSEPTLMVEPSVSTHDAALAPSVSLALLPQPTNNRLDVAIKLPATRADLLTRDRVVRVLNNCMNNLSSYQQDSRPDGCRLANAGVGDAMKRRIGTLETQCFCGMSVRHEQINDALTRCLSAVQWVLRTVGQLAQGAPATGGR
jgi:hypothetical protein